MLPILNYFLYGLAAFLMAKPILMTVLYYAVDEANFVKWLRRAEFSIGLTILIIAVWVI